MSRSQEVVRGVAWGPAALTLEADNAVLLLVLDCRTHINHGKQRENVRLQ